MRPRFFAVLALPVLAALALASCLNEAEGQPCDPLAGNSGNDDCRNGLVCTQVSAGTRCCPTDRATATAPECVLSSTVSDAANPTPPDSSTTETSTFDAPLETATEAAPETGGEAAPTGDASDGAPATDAPTE